LSSWFKKFEIVSLSLSIFFLFWLFIIIFIDVIFRAMRIEFFWGSESGGILMGWLIFFSLPIVCYQRKHITTDFLIRLLPLKLNLIITLIGHILMFLYLIIILWVCIELTQKNFYSDLRSQGILRIPLYIVQTGISIGIIAMCISQLVVIVEEYLQLKSLKINRENTR